MSVAGAAVISWALVTLPWALVPLVGLVLAGGIDYFQVELRKYKAKDKTSITLDTAAVFIMLGLFGPQWAVLTGLFNCLIFGLTGRVAYYKVAFNAGTVAMATAVASVLVYATPVSPLITAPLAALAYCLINTGSVALVLGGLSGRSLTAVWKENYSWLVWQQMTLGIAGLVLGLVSQQVGWSALMIGLPLPMIIYTYKLYAEAYHKHAAELEELSTELITTLAAVVDARDAYTFGHSAHVARYSVAIAEKLGYNGEALKRLYRSALLHDIGKVGIPEQILFKPGRLTPEEYEIMKRHTTIGYDIIKQISALREASLVALRHHERPDGKGYPSGLSLDAVDMDSRIVCVADTLETMLSDRPYRKGRGLAEALAEVDRCSGTQFDPVVVEALQRVVADKGHAFFINSAEQVQSGTIRVVRTWADGELQPLSVNQ